MTDPRVFLVDVVAALSAAGDLTMGQPPEHGARSAVLAVAIALESGADVQAAADGFYTTLLRWSGCTANAHETAAMVGDDIAGRAGFDGLAPVDDADGRVAALAAAHCDAAQLLAARLGLGPAVVRALGQVFERWDKRGVPTGLGGDELEPAVRCAVLATETEILSRRYGYATALEIVADRAGGAYDPRLAAVLPAAVARWRRELAAGSVEEVLRASEPLPAGGPVPADVAAVCRALADFVDVKVPWLAGHSRRVATLARDAAGLLRPSTDDTRLLYLAGLVHDLGRVAVSNAVWDVRRPLSTAEWEVVRLHPYYTERILARVPALAAVSRVAGHHHERLDGSGYHRQLPAAALSLPARVLAVADAAEALAAARPHRPAMSDPARTATLTAAAGRGELDPAAVDAVLAAQGLPARLARPGRSGLSARELQVLALLVRGATNRDIATTLGISPKTVGRHVESLYAKLDVRNRASATLVALERGLLP